MIEALVFDFDGIIVDTESPELVSYEELYAQYDVEFPVETWIATVGGELTFNAYTYLQEAVGRPLDIDTIRTWRRQRHLDLTRQEKLCPGVREYLTGAGERGWKIGLASSSPRSWVLPLLEQHDLVRFFDAVVTADQVAKVKPDPALYNAALQQLDVAPERSVAIEDSVNGLRAAKAAGMFCVVVPNPVTARLSWPDGLEDLRLGSLEDMSLEQLTANLARV